jgi:hypothetical protein
MIIGAIRHKSDEGVEKYLSKLESEIRSSYEYGFTPDIIIGPDYALSRRHGGDIETPNSLEERQEILKQIKDISKEYPKTRIIPGTMFWHDNTNAHLSAPMYSSGRMIQEFFKERSNGEFEVAKKLSLTYKKGDNDKNRFIKDGKNISLEICGDHGTQDVKGIDLQLILAYDNRAGFYITINNDNSSRLGLVCNGYDAETKLNYYDAKKKSLINIKPIFSDNKIDLYRIFDDRKNI